VDPAPGGLLQQQYARVELMIDRDEVPMSKAQTAFLGGSVTFVHNVPDAGNVNDHQAFRIFPVNKQARLFPGFRVVSQCCVTGGAGAG
jgi:hypothetical protein